MYDRELGFYSRVDLTVPGWVQQDKLPVQRGGPGGLNPDFDLGNSSTAAGGGRNDTTPVAGEDSRRKTFWTTCPYCYLLYEFPKAYEGCCLKCQKCERSFHGL